MMERIFFRLNFLIRNGAHFLAISFIATLMWSCGKGTSPSTTASANFYENLSYLRDTSVEISNLASLFYVEKEKFAAIVPKYDLKYEMDSVLKIIQDSRKSVTFLNGYTVLVYSGNNRDAANEAKKKVNELFETYKPEITYIQPNFKVNVGKFYDRLEANRVFIDLKTQFPSALVLPERIYFR
jgi:hypothetical protein